jgi:DNA gyrase subunit A
MGVEEGDSVIAVELSDGKEQIFIGTRDGMAIRFDETDVRSMGRSAYGVRGITLRDDDEVVAMEVVREGRHDAHRRAERLRQAHRARGVPLQSRGGVGIINIQTSTATARSSASRTCTTTTRCC